MSEAALSLLEVVALALPAYALVLKTIADQPVRYPPEAVDGLFVAIAVVLAAGVVLIGWLMYSRLSPVPAVGGLLVIVSFGAMLYGMYHFSNRQEELEETPAEDEDTATK